MIAVLASVCFAVLETEPTVYGPWRSQLEAAEVLLTALFSMEYAARLWSSAEQTGDDPAFQKRMRFILSPSGLLDLAVVLTGTGSRKPPAFLWPALSPPHPP